MDSFVNSTGCPQPHVYVQLHWYVSTLSGPGYQAAVCARKANLCRTTGNLVRAVTVTKASLCMSAGLWCALLNTPTCLCVTTTFKMIEQKPRHGFVHPLEYMPYRNPGCGHLLTWQYKSLPDQHEFTSARLVKKDERAFQLCSYLKAGAKSQNPAGSPLFLYLERTHLQAELKNLTENKG